MLQSHLTVGAQGLSPVVYCLHSFPTSGSGLSQACCWPSCHLFTDGSHEFSSLLLPASLVCFQQLLPPPLSASFQFYCLFRYFFFAREDQSVQGCCAGLSQGWLRDTAWHLALPKVSQACLELVASGLQPAEAWWWPTCSLSVSWCGEAFQRVAVQVPKFQLSLVLHFCQVWHQHLSKFPDSQSSHCLHLCPSHHFSRTSGCFLIVLIKPLYLSCLVQAMICQNLSVKELYL
jgi:hypothetical protein